MIQLLHEDPFFRVEHNAPDKIFRIARTTRPFADLAEVEHAYQTLARVLSSVPPDAKLFLDIRDGPARNDPAFESVVKRVCDPLFTRFTRVAILARTAAGRLQVHRMNQGLPPTVAVFEDEDRAFDHLYA